MESYLKAWPAILVSDALALTCLYALYVSALFLGDAIRDRKPSGILVAVLCADLVLAYIGFHLFGHAVIFSWPILIGTLLGIFQIVYLAWPLPGSPAPFSRSPR